MKQVLGDSQYRHLRSAGSRPRLGVLATHAIQYQAPLYQELHRRGVVDLEVAFLSQRGARPYGDPGFGVSVAWNIDLLGGYRWTLLEHESLGHKARWPFAVTRWLRQQDIVVLHGHADPPMLLAATACRALQVPYMPRGDSRPQTAAIGLRRLARHALASFCVKGAAGALVVGQCQRGFLRVLRQHSALLGSPQRGQRTVPGHLRSGEAHASGAPRIAWS